MQVLVVYLVFGMGTATAMWAGNQDELDMSLGMELDDAEDLPAMRLLLSVFFLFAWPLVFWDAFSRRP
jgi:hypothetical protein